MTPAPVPVRRSEPPPEPAPEPPQERLARLGRAVLSGAMGAEAARAAFRSYSAGRDARTRAWMAHYLRSYIANAPPDDLLARAAGCVAETERRCGGLLSYAPAWVRATRSAKTAALYARLHFLALALGYGGRTFTMAQGRVAAVFNCDGGHVREFLRKAERVKFIDLAQKGRVLSSYIVKVKNKKTGEEEERTRYRYAVNVYRLARRVGAADGALMVLDALMCERLPEVAYEDGGARQRLADFLTD